MKKLDPLPQYEIIKDLWHMPKYETKVLSVNCHPTFKFFVLYYYKFGFQGPVIYYQSVVNIFPNSTVLES